MDSFFITINQTVSDLQITFRWFHFFYAGTNSKTFKYKVTYIQTYKKPNKSKSF